MRKVEVGKHGGGYVGDSCCREKSNSNLLLLNFDSGSSFDQLLV